MMDAREDAKEVRGGPKLAGTMWRRVGTSSSTLSGAL
jgi:hypothetical protein